MDSQVTLKTNPAHPAGSSGYNNRSPAEISDLEKGPPVIIQMRRARVAFRRPGVSAVIPAYNEETRIRAVLDAVVESGITHEIIVVSDGSTDNTLAVAESVPGVRAIQLPRNRGKAFALREGARHASGEVLLFLD